MQPLNPATELSVVLSAQDWNEVIEILARSTVKPYVTTAPLIQRIGAQVHTAAERAQTEGDYPRMSETGSRGLVRDDAA